MECSLILKKPTNGSNSARSEVPRTRSAVGYLRVREAAIADSNSV